MGPILKPGGHRSRMAHNRTLLFLCVGAILFCSCEADFFSDLFAVSWGSQNVHPNDTANSVEISLTSDGTGATFSTNNTYLFGSFSVQIKLVPGNSAGTVAAFFIISNGDAHDEVDFEFLGNVSGQPYLLHTNLFSNGTGEREEDFYLWFDPTADFHTYQVIWNHELILWLVDNIPVRVYKNISNINPLSFPSFRPMVVSSCIFDASSWATEGGQIPVDYSQAPFNVEYKNYVFDACLADGTSVGTCTTNYEGNWWEQSPYNSFNSNFANQMAWVRQHYLHYDYCSDTTRYPTPPVECQYNENLSR